MFESDQRCYKFTVYSKLIFRLRCRKAQHEEAAEMHSTNEVSKDLCDFEADQPECMIQSAPMQDEKLRQIFDQDWLDTDWVGPSGQTKE